MTTLADATAAHIEKTSDYRHGSDYQGQLYVLSQYPNAWLERDFNTAWAAWEVASRHLPEDLQGADFLHAVRVASGDGASWAVRVLEARLLVEAANEACAVAAAEGRYVF